MTTGQRHGDRADDNMATSRTGSWTRLTWLPPRSRPLAGRLSAPFDIPVGRVAVVADPFDNVLVLIDLSKGRYQQMRTGTSPAWSRTHSARNPGARGRGRRVAQVLSRVVIAPRMRSRSWERSAPSQSWVAAAESRWPAQFLAGAMGHPGRARVSLQLREIVMRLPNR